MPRSPCGAARATLSRRLQIIDMLVADLHLACTSLVGNDTAMTLMRRPPAQLFIGEPANQCSWVLSDLLRYGVHVPRHDTFCLRSESCLRPDEYSILTTRGRD